MSFFFGARGGSRTRTPLRALAPEASESTNSTTRASIIQFAEPVALKQDVSYHNRGQVSTGFFKFFKKVLHRGRCGGGKARRPQTGDGRVVIFRSFKRDSPCRLQSPSQQADSPLCTRGPCPRGGDVGPSQSASLPAPPKGSLGTRLRAGRETKDERRGTGVREK